MTETRKAGEIWTITDARKGTLTIRLHEDVNSSTVFFDADLIEGKPVYISNEVRIGYAGQRAPIAGQDAMSFRQSLIAWDNRVNE